MPSGRQRPGKAAGVMASGGEAGGGRGAGEAGRQSGCREDCPSEEGALPGHDHDYFECQ